MKTRFIFNPVSGRHARNARLLPILRDFIGARALDADLVATEGPGHATVLAREAVNAGCTRVVAVGGDGTMNEVAQALIHTPAALALVPCGSGNGLALHLGLPLAPLAALELVAAIGGRVAAVDTGSVNGHPFFNAMGLGLDADVSRRFNHLTTRGLPAYARTAFTAFAQRRSEHCIVQTGSTRESLEILLIAVANSDQYGNRAYIAPGARVDDGQLDLVAIRPVGLIGAISLGARLFLGNIDASPFVRRLRGSRFTIERPAAGLVHTDGETHETGATVEVAVHARSLRIVVPVTCRALAYSTESAPAGFALQLP
jgi:YegS/Rv2252/BmrU family lipid kinase